MTLRQLFENHLDIFGRPRRYFFQLLSFFATNDQHREKLLGTYLLIEFASAEGQNDLYAYSHKTKRTTFEVLEDFNSVRVPLKYLLDLVPLMRPRYFSISSSYAIDHNNLQLTVAIVNYKTILQERRVGVCTDWMSQLKLNDSIAFDLAPGTFTLPIDSETPIICIGPGTGVAPMRSLLREYTSLSNAQNVLFFGCRSSTADYFYKEEWSLLSERQKLKFIPAFSRDQPDKIYVQDRLIENGELVWNLIDQQNAVVYLSG
jgi:sulfite reductase alpha subunit-like flavoprotein